MPYEADLGAGRVGQPDAEGGDAWQGVREDRHGSGSCGDGHATSP
ncbi:MULTISPECIES: hypothetical protein [unclassified Streptomyces]|nr:MULTISPECIES: hypothetical protein [unclassified Streptomyces]